MTNLRDEARWLIGEIGDAKRLAKAVGKPQLANSAIEAGRIEEYDADGALMQIVGEQYDGTHAPVTVNGPVPPEPVAPVITVGASGVEGRWSGKFVGDMLSPMDFSHVSLHAARTEVFSPSNETQLATITGELGDVATKILDAGEWTFGLVAVSKAGKWSDMSETVTLDVPDFSGGTSEVLDALLGLGSAVDGKITVDIKPPTLADGEGKPADALWNELDPTSREQVAVWRWTGTLWEKMPLSEMIVPKINIAEGIYGRLRGVNLESDAVDGKIITGATTQTDKEPNKGLKLDNAGMRVYSTEGGEPVTEIRADGGTVYSITDPATGDTLATMGADGGIAGQALDIAQDPVFKGMPLLGSTTPDAFQSDQTGILDYLPRGNVAYAARNVAGITCSNGNRALLEFSFDEIAGRSYQVTVQPLPITSTININSLLRLYSEAGANPAKPTFSSSEWYRFAAGGTTTTLIGGTFLHNAYSSGRRRVLIALFTGNQTVTILDQAAASNLRVVVTDIGPIFGEVGIDRNDSDENGVIVAPTPPAPEKKNYTKTYEATGWRSYRSDGSTYNYQTSRMYQGNSPAVGALRSNAVFPSMISDLSGATITSVEAHFYFDHWYYPQGGTARIHLHSDVGGVNDTIAPQTYAVQSGNWKPGSGRWVKIPSQFWNGFKNGDYTGVGLGGTTTTQYGYARGSSTRIRIKYSK